MAIELNSIIRGKVSSLVFYIETTAEWMRAETVSQGVQELYSRFDTAILVDYQDYH